MTNAKLERMMERLAVMGAESARRRKAKKRDEIRTRKIRNRMSSRERQACVRREEERQAAKISKRLEKQDSAKDDLGPSKPLNSPIPPHDWTHPRDEEDSAYWRLLVRSSHSDDIHYLTGEEVGDIIQYVTSSYPTEIPARMTPAEEFDAAERWIFNEAWLDHP